MNETNRKYGDFISDWQRLLSAMMENAELLGDVTAEKTALEKALAQVQEGKVQQDLFLGQKQRTTQLLRDALAQGKEAARQVRLLVKLRLGPRNEKLVQFRVAPLRKRGSRKVALTKKPGEGTTPTAA
jgi:hypothetical protein